MTADFTFGKYKCRLEEGEGQELILSFSGIGNPAKDSMAYEWRSSLAKVSKAHVIYVMDLSRSWYNTDEGYQELIAFIADFIKTNGITKTTAIGLSMGAYGAILLSQEVKLDRVLSISNRFTLDAKFPDKRNVSFIQAIQPPSRGSVVEAGSAETEYVFFFCIDDPNDMRQLSLAAAKGFYGKVFGYHGHHNLGSTFAAFKLHFLKAAFAGKDEALTTSGFFKLTEQDVSFIRKASSLTSREAWADYLAQHKVEKVHLIPKSTAPHYYEAISPPPLAMTELACTVQEGAQYLRYGWSRVDDRGVWSVGKLHGISMYLADGLTSARLMLTLKLRPLVRGGREQRLRVLINGEERFSTTYTEGADTEVKVEFPAVQHLDIVLETPDHVSPKTLGVSNDWRELGVYLREFSVKKLWGLKG